MEEKYVHSLICQYGYSVVGKKSLYCNMLALVGVKLQGKKIAPTFSCVG